MDHQNPHQDLHRGKDHIEFENLVEANSANIRFGKTIVAEVSSAVVQHDRAQIVARAATFGRRLRGAMLTNSETATGTEK